MTRIFALLFVFAALASCSAQRQTIPIDPPGCEGQPGENDGGIGGTGNTQCPEKAED